MKETQQIDTRILLSVREMAGELGIGLTFAWKLIGDKRIRSVRLGRRRMILRDDLSSFIEHELKGQHTALTSDY